MKLLYTPKYFQAFQYLIRTYGNNDTATEEASHAAGSTWEPPPSSKAPTGSGSTDMGFCKREEVLQSAYLKDTPLEQYLTKIMPLQMKVEPEWIWSVPTPKYSLNLFARSKSWDLPKLWNSRGAKEGVKLMATFYSRNLGCWHTIYQNSLVKPRIIEYITKDCPSCAKVAITVAPGIGYSAATGISAQAEPAQLVSWNFGSATLQAPPLERRSW